MRGAEPALLQRAHHARLSGRPEPVLFTPRQRGTIGSHSALWRLPTALDA